MARKSFDLTDERISPVKVIFYLAWPLFLEQILSTLVSFVDTAMVGALGVEATASVSISNSFVFLLNGVIMALGTGFTAYVARSVGSRDYEAAKAYIRHAIVLLLLAAAALAALLRGLWVLLVVRQRREEEEAEMPAMENQYAEGLRF